MFNASPSYKRGELRSVEPSARAGGAASIVAEASSRQKLTAQCFPLTAYGWGSS